MSRTSFRRFTGFLLLCGLARGAGGQLTITKIDPPNWYAALPRPMLLVRGDGFTGATFSFSDPALQIESSVISANGHYAQLFLTASPSKPEVVHLTVTKGSNHTQALYSFAQRRAATSGMAGFSNADVMYLIVTDRFADGNPANDGPDATSSASSAAAAAERAKARGWHGGDLPGITQHLDYLQALGVTTIWPTPVYQNHAPEAFHGYHATDYYSVDEHYGTLADLQALVAALHARGMKLILDTVPNHVGPAHPWVHDSPSPDWLHGTLANHVAGETHFEALIDPHAPDRDRVSTLKGWFVDSLPDMNTENPAVAQYLRQNAVWWIEQTGADGLRIDTFPYVDRPFWHAFHAELAALYPRLTEVGEVSSRDPEITSAFAAGVTRNGVDTGLYTPFDFPFFHAARDLFGHNAPFTRLTQVLMADELYPHPERLVTFLGNHDESRLAEAVPDPALRQLAYTLLLTTRGTPQMYQGDELAQRGGNDPENRHDFPFGFPSEGASGYNPQGGTAEQQYDFDFVTTLLALRRQHPALQSGEEQILEADADTFVYLRTSAAGERIVVALNKSHIAHTLTIALNDTCIATAVRSTVLLGEKDALSFLPHSLTIHLHAESAVAATLQ